MTTKAPWQSKTILFGAITAVLAAVAVFVPAAATLKALIDANAGAIGMVWGVLAIILRLVTKDKVQLGD